MIDQQYSTCLMIVINEKKKMKLNSSNYLRHESIERESDVAAKDLNEDSAKSSMLIAYNKLDTSIHIFIVSGMRVCICI